MTDQFFPAKHLWEPWVRVEDHVNTGFLYAARGPSRALRRFLRARGSPPSTISRSVLTELAQTVFQVDVQNTYSFVPLVDLISARVDK